MYSTRPGRAPHRNQEKPTVALSSFFHVLHCCFKEERKINVQELKQRLKACNILHVRGHYLKPGSSFLPDIARATSFSTYSACKTTTFTHHMRLPLIGYSHIQLLEVFLLTLTSSHWNMRTVVVFFLLGWTEITSRELNTPGTSLDFTSWMSLRAMDSSSS